MTDATVTTTASIDVQVQAGNPGGEVLLINESACDDLGPIRMALPHALWVGMGTPNTLRLTIETRCDGCGCTDSEACLGSCSWAAPGLCSGCA